MHYMYLFYKITKPYIIITMFESPDLLQNEIFKQILKNDQFNYFFLPSTSEEDTLRPPTE